MKGSREAILSAVRASQPEPAPLPELVGGWIAYDDPVEQFCATVRAIGGDARVVDGPAAAHALVAGLTAGSPTARVVSLVQGVGSSTVDLAALATPHALDGLDLAVVPGRIGVAENGAVWVTDEDVPHRAVYFLCEHLVLVLPASSVVPHMHAAYERLSIPSRAGGGQAFGAFLAGPSKTADIEQSLVIGAQGPRSALVLVTRD